MIDEPNTTDHDHPALDEPLDPLLRDALADAARTYHRPPAEDAVPFEAMWQAVERRTFGTPARELRRRPVWRRQWVGMAAALLVGVGIGRATLVVGSPATAPQPAVAAIRPTEPHPRSPASRVPTAAYLDQTAALLIALSGDPGRVRLDRRLVARAGELLLTTRLLLDSPAAADPSLHGLLEDLELVLAQVVRLPDERAAARREGLDLIHQAVEQRDVLPRLRSVAGDYAAD